MSFAIQAKGLEYLAKTRGTLQPHLYAVPREIDMEVAAIKLRALGITIDALSEEQKAYMSKVE
jgi:adenosylhomocysteinase